MTREEILALQPGRELDALIAEKVMNLCVLDHVQGYGDGCVMSDKGMDEWFKHPEYGKVADPDLLEPYSTDISAAWEVVEKLRETDDMMAPDIFCYKDQYCVLVRRKGIKVNVQTAPEAIVKAALLAVME